MLSIDAAEPTSDTRRLPSPDRSPMRIMPPDLRQMKLKTALRGFDKAEVTALMMDAAECYEQTLRENERLRQELARLEAMLAQHRGSEDSLKSTLLTAQKIADNMREDAADDAARVLREAELRAELLTQRAQSRLEDLQREVDGLRLKRREAEVSVESIISTLHNTLDFIREQEQRERQHDKVIPHRPLRIEAAG
jgi:cell division initiation protein